MQAFSLTTPTRSHIPLLVEIPHAGLGIPESIAENLHAESRFPWRDADLFVDKLFDDCVRAGATKLVAHLSRYVVDLNRSIAIDEDVPHGIVWKQDGCGKRLWNEPLGGRERAQRIQSFYSPYHKLLRETLDMLRQRFGHVVLLAAHSMPSNAIPNVADIVIGSCSGTSASHAVVRTASDHFRSAGLRVEHDFPYKGGWTTKHYGDPSRGMHALQVEIKRSIYMDEENLKPDDQAFSRLQELLMELIHRLGRLRFH